MIPIYTIPARFRGELGKLEFGGAVRELIPALLSILRLQDGGRSRLNDYGLANCLLLTSTNATSHFYCGA